MFEELKKVTIIGVGGGAAYYVAKVFALLGIKVIGFDQKESELTDELKALGVDIRSKNPDDWNFTDSDLIVYTTALPKRLQEEMFSANKGKEIEDSGTYYEKIVESFAAKEFESDEKALKAIKESNIAPLYSINFGNTILIGVTGSKGKTTTAQMLYDTLNNLGARVSLINTIGGKILNESVETGLHTSTPSAQELALLFTKMIESKSDIIVVEVSSHAIATGRVSGLKFDYAVLTNIQPEHLDFHKTFEHVIKTKKQLVTSYLKPGGVAIVNLDDETIREKVLPDLPKFAKEIYTISLEKRKNDVAQSYAAEQLHENESSIEFDLQDLNNDINVGHFVVPFTGKFNAINIFASIIVSKRLGYENSVAAIANLHTVSGRNEVLQTAPFKVILDFAHTPESLEEILRAYKIQPTTKRVIVVFGSAGQRDTIKRPRMGAAAAKYADITILTAEDPRTENLVDINNQIASGWQQQVKDSHLESERQLLRIEDISLEEQCRTEAIRKAISLAQEGDVIICTGKGPEKSMCIGFDEKPWNEKETILAILKEK